jgi:hypothetical protein
MALVALITADRPTGLAATNKSLANKNKSRSGGKATKKREIWQPIVIRLIYAMKSTTKIRFTEPQIAFVMRAHPNCNLDQLTELFFEFDQAGKIVDCIGTIKDGANIDHNYAGRGLALLYERARRQLAVQETSATILQFPNAIASSHSGSVKP